MAQNIKSFYAIVLIASFASSAYAITCYVCDSNDDFKCREWHNYTSEFLFACEWTSAPSYLSYGYGYMSNTGCMIKNVEEDGESRVIRSCYWGNISDQKRGCRNPPLSTYTTVSCTVCDFDGCNADSNSDSDSDSNSDSNDGYEMSHSCVTKSIAVLIALFFAITRWMS